MEAPPSHLISCVSVSAAQWQCCYRHDQEEQQTIRGWGGYKYTRTMGLSMGGQSDHNTIRIPALCHKLFRTQKNKIIKLEGKTFCTIYFRLGPAIATVKALAHLSHRRWRWWDRSWYEVHVGDGEAGAGILTREVTRDFGFTIFGGGCKGATPRRLRQRSLVTGWVWSPSSLPSPSRILTIIHFSPSK